MGKCIRCGKHGLFLKTNSEGLCKRCQLEALDAQIADKSKLLEQARADAKTKAIQEMEVERDQLNADILAQNSYILALLNERDQLTRENADAKNVLDATIQRIVKTKALGKSILYAWEHITQNLTPFDHIDDLCSSDIEALLPEQQLNCLSIRELRSRYNVLRKQIIMVCNAYEDRYTTKANSTLYKLMVLGLEAELENILHKLSFGKLENAVSAVQTLTAKYYALACEGNQSIVPTLQRFIAQIESLYLDVIATEYEYYIQRERAREEQRALKEQMRQEAEERKRLEAEKKRVEIEETKYKKELERLNAQIQSAHDAELENLRKRLEEVTKLLNGVDERKTEIINLQNGKAGTVYIISNIGAFGDHMFKVGMTRRLEPQDRIDELSNASVPFPFDVHSFIFSQDAVALETALHRELNEHRVNKVNLRKEFFDISIEELQALVERIDPTAPFRTTMLAEQYRQSQSIAAVPDQYINNTL